MINEKISEKSDLINEVIEEVRSTYFIKELEKEETKDCLRVFLIHNPIELLKILYVFCGTGITIARKDVNTTGINHINTFAMSQYLTSDYVKAFESFLDELKISEEIEIADAIIDSGDLGLPIDIYADSFDFYDDHVYADTLIINHDICRVIEPLKTIIAEIISSIKVEVFTNTLKSLL